MAKSRKRSGPENPASSPTATADDPRNAAAGEAGSDDVRGDDARTDAGRRPDVRTDSRRRERVARRAYELYLSRGGGHGADWDDWLAAEREVNEADPSRDPDGSEKSE